MVHMPRIGSDSKRRHVMKTFVFHSPLPSHLSYILSTMFYLFVLLAPIVPGTSAMWMPDDAVTATSTSSSVLVPASAQGVMVQHVVHPGVDRSSLKNLSESNLDGSGGRVAADEEEDDYTDEAKWIEEGQDESLVELGAESEEYGYDAMPDIWKAQDIREGSVKAEEPSADFPEGFDSLDDDMFFEDGTVHIPDGQVQGKFPTPAPDPSDHSDRAKLDEEHSQQLHEHTVKSLSEDTSATHSESNTSSLTTVTSIRPASREEISDAQIFPLNRQASTIPPNDDGHQEKEEPPSKFSPALLFAVGSDTGTDIINVDVANPNAKESNEYLGTDIVSPASSTNLSASSSTVATATTTSTVSVSTLTSSEPRSGTSGVTESNTNADSVSISVSGADSIPGSPADSIPNSRTDSIADSSSDTGPDSDGQTSTSSTTPHTSPSPPPACLQECRTSLDVVDLQVTPADVRTSPGAHVTLQCQLTAMTETDPEVRLGWKFQPENGSEACFFGPMGTGGDTEKCTGITAEVEEEFSNQTFTVISLKIADATPSNSGKYACTATVSCCGGTAHAQTISRNETAVITVYTKPRYAAQLAAVSVMCLCLLTGILGSACFQRRRRRKKRISGPGHVHYEPVRLLHLPQSEVDGDRGDVDDEDDDFDEGDNAVPASVEIGSVRVNPMAEVPLTPPEMLPFPPEVTSSARESQFEFPRPPSELLKRMSSNVGFD